jgi:hypothetical protein
MLLEIIVSVLALVPNNKLTPGEVAETNAAKVCVVGYSDTVRHTTESTKRYVLREYGLEWLPRGSYEIDHRIPLELGGADVVLNLWPESYKTKPWNAHVKDALEDRLHAMVCHEHSITLRQAQDAFKGNWTKAYRRYVRSR